MKKVPWRIGSTSYVYPADILPNVQQLAQRVQDIELVLFEIDDLGSNLPGPEVAIELRALAEVHRLSYTVHLPLDIQLGDVASLDKAQRAIAATRLLEPYAYIMHLDGRVLIGEPTSDTVARWQDEAYGALVQVVDWVGDPRLVCVENLEGWKPEYMHPVVNAAGAGRCIDIGHLWLAGQEPVSYLNSHLHNTRVIHLHGVGERDHQSLQHVRADQLDSVTDTLRRAGFNGVVTLEVFNPPDLVSSLDAFERSIARSEQKWQTGNSS